MDVNDNTVSTILKKLDTLEERIRNMPTKEDIIEIKRGIASKDYIDGKFDVVSLKISNNENDIKELQSLSNGRNDKMLNRMAQIGSLIAIILVLIEFLMRVRLGP